jgi:hypothetical protein
VVLGSGIVEGVLAPVVVTVDADEPGESLQAAATDANAATSASDDRVRRRIRTRCHTVRTIHVVQLAVG